MLVWSGGAAPDADAEFPAHAGGVPAAVPVRVRQEASNSLNNRFRPDPLLRTRAVLQLDDDVILRCGAAHQLLEISSTVSSWYWDGYRSCSFTAGDVPACPRLPLCLPACLRLPELPPLPGCLLPAGARTWRAALRPGAATPTGWWASSRGRCGCPPAVHRSTSPTCLTPPRAAPGPTMCC